MAKNENKNKGNAATRNKTMLQALQFESDIRRMQKRAFDDGMEHGYGLAVMIMLWLLHTEHGFGKKRLAVFMCEINDFCMDYIRVGADGTEPAGEGEFCGVSLRDIAEGLATETGIYINTDTWQMQVPGLEIRRTGEEGANKDDKNQ